MTAVIACIAGFVVGFACACVIAARRRIRPERIKFGILIQQQIGAIPERGVREFYFQTKPKIRDAVFALEFFLTLPLHKKERSTLEALWREYDAIDLKNAKHCIEDEWEGTLKWKDPLNRHREGAWQKTLSDLHKMTKPPGEWQKASDILRFNLERFLEFAH